MSYYQVESWTGTPVLEMLKKQGITFFGGTDQEAHLNIDDHQLPFCLMVLRNHFDVMIVERSGKTYVFLDEKNKMFRQR